MKRLLGLLLGLFFVIAFISTAEAINISLADVENGVAVVQGSKAAPNATITWEGSAVTKSNKNGGFSFTGVVPADCTGTLSDGVTTLDVPLTSCKAPAAVPQTGQTTSYAAGNDGALQKGVPLPTPRFTDNGNGTIKDNLTGLIWLKNAFCPNTRVDWQTALTYIARLNAEGTMNFNDCGDLSKNGSHQTDWRLPNVRELFSLVDFAFSNLDLSNAAGTGQGSSNDPFTNFWFVYWSSTTYTFDSASALAVSFTDGTVPPVGKNNEFGVLAVRGGS